MVSPIEMIAWFDKEGKINPIRFKVLEGDENQVIKIDKVLSRDAEKLAGCLMWRFVCLSVIDGVEKRYSIKYDMGNNRWILFL